MDPTAALAPWHDFFAVAAAAAATLLGLTFIGLSLHLDRAAADASLLSMAVASAVTLFYPVIICLLMLVPPAAPWTPTGGLLITAAFAVVASGVPLFDPRLRGTRWKHPRWNDLLRFGLPWVAAILLVPVAVWLVADPARAVYPLALIVIVYLILGTQSAWNILLGHVGSASASTAGDEAR